MNPKRKGQAKLFLIAILLLLPAVIVGAVLLNKTASSPETPQLATEVNHQSINTPYIQNYLQTYNNFADIPYEKVLPNSAVQARFTGGNQEDNIKGFEIANKRYAIHLIACDYNYQQCFFRINGVPTGALHASAQAQTTFDLDDTYQIRVDGMQFDYCDNRRFCNLHYEAYDIVNVSVMPK